MITKMTKYSMILLSGDLEDFMSGIQQLGMVDITRSTAVCDEASRRMTDIITRCKSASDSLRNLMKEQPDLKPEEHPELTGEKLLSAVEENISGRTDIATELASLKEEYDRAEPWGEFSPSDIDRLKKAGLTPHFYSVSDKKYQTAWEEQFPIWILNRYAGQTYFAVLSSDKDGSYDFPYADASHFPSRPASAVLSDIENLKTRQERLLSEAAGFALRSTELSGLSDKVFSELDLHYAETSTLKEGEGTICVVEGFAPTEDDGKVKEYLDSRSVYYTADAAKGEDNPPVKLRNNWFARLFEPIGGLYELPNYDELDLTPYFAPFYMLFFGFCLGDMGYGLILVIAGIAAAIALPKYKAYGKLIAWLGVGSLIMPLLSGTFFGMKLADIIPSMPDNIKVLFFSDLKMFWFAIVFGLFQIVFARMLKAIFAFTRHRWDEALTEVGWSMIIVWAACAYAGSQTDLQLLPHIVSQILLFGGLILVLFCSKPAKFFLLRPIKGIVSLYDITGIFGDMLSYIRLFGLGTTGGILALVINSIAMSLSGIPYVGWPVTVIFLIFGHLAVMGLSCLGAFVHPVRLTFVEFYKNVGFEGGGRAYKPLKSYNNNK
ncbi:MAG TPA: hypothetical protein IAC04_07080 [Candidatus Coprenecus stercoravium]|uniref:V-type ATP synthase subunit I n=1 Tax=Candidatus Coprenecus stercoravium TaxID=2840735 RepID=A0A9D2K978_9BACT|nr:hypothetical protein [Candidatus Coprenecus stercoravium]